MPTNKEAVQVRWPAAHLEYEEDDLLVPRQHGGFRKQSRGISPHVHSSAMSMAKEDMTVVEEEIERL